MNLVPETEQPSVEYTMQYFKADESNDLNKYDGDPATWGVFYSPRNLLNMGMQGYGKQIPIMPRSLNSGETLSEVKDGLNYYFALEPSKIPKELKDRTVIGSETNVGNIPDQRIRLSSWGDARYGDNYGYHLETGKTFPLSNTDAIVMDIKGVLVGDDYMRTAQGTTPVTILDEDGNPHNKKATYLALEVLMRNNDSLIVDEKWPYPDQQIQKDKQRQERNYAFRKIQNQLSSAYYEDPNTGQLSFDIDKAADILQNLSKQPTRPGFQGLDEGPSLQGEINILRQAFNELSQTDEYKEMLYSGNYFETLAKNIEEIGRSFELKRRVGTETESGIKKVPGPFDVFGKESETIQDDVMISGRKLTRKGEEFLEGKGFEGTYPVSAELKAKLGLGGKDSDKKVSDKAYRTTVLVKIDQSVAPFLGDFSDDYGKLIWQFERQMDESKLRQRNEVLYTPFDYSTIK